MDQNYMKSKHQGAPAESDAEYHNNTAYSGGSGPHSRSRIDRNSVPSSGTRQGTRKSPANTFPLTAKETEGFLHIATATAKIASHYDLYLLLQNEVQAFIPHEIMISAWGDFHGSKPRLDVISSIQGVRTGQLNDCGCSIEQLLSGFFSRWVAGGRRPLLLNDAAARLIMRSTCGCALHSALRRMGSVLVHGIHNARDNLDSLYATMNPVVIKTGKSTERFFFLVDTLVAQFDVAFRKVAAWKPDDTITDETNSVGQNNLSEREQEIVKLITSGKTNTEIAEVLGISAFTVKNHTQRIFRKLGATNRTQAVAKYQQESLPAQ